MRIAIDAAGRPIDVAPRSCPEVFRASAEAAALRHRFWPLRDAAGRTVPASFDLGIAFQPDQGARKRAQQESGGGVARGTLPNA